MNQDLYFIPILARAFAVPDRGQALASAFQEVERLGQLKQYQTGYRQFQRFMAESYCVQVPKVQLVKNGAVITELTPCAATQEVQVPGITPGEYSIRLATGRLLWSGTLEKQDLLWAEAFPSAALPLAADTEEPRRVWTQELKLLRDEIVVHVYPGMEQGTIGIQINRWKQS